MPGDSEDGESLDMARSLLNQPVDERGCTLLHVAARAGKAEAVCLLLEAGADPALRYGCRVPSGSQPQLWESSDSATGNGCHSCPGTASTSGVFMGGLGTEPPFSLPAWSGMAAGGQCHKMHPALLVSSSKGQDETKLPCRGFEKQEGFGGFWFRNKELSPPWL